MGREENNKSQRSHQSIPEQLWDRLSQTRRVLRTIEANYGKLVGLPGTFRMGPEQLLDLPDNFVSILAKGTPVDNDGITNLISYAAPRLPAEVFNPDSNVTFTFNSDPQFFLNEDGLKEGVRTAPSRSRWFKVDVIEAQGATPQKTHITVHAQSQIAVIETMLHVAVVERLKDKVKSIMHKTHKSSEEITFLENIERFIPTDNTKEKHKENLISRWAHRAVWIEGTSGMTPWDELKSSPTSLSLAEKAHKLLEGKNQPTVLLFSNSYSLPNILSHYLLHKKNGDKTIQAHIIEKAQTAWKDHLSVDPDRTSITPLEALGESITDLKDTLTENQRNFIIDNQIIFNLTRNGGNIFGDEVIDTFVHEFNNPERLSQCGVETVLHKNQSPTADPLHYIDFSKITDEVINGLNPLYRAAVLKLKNKSLSALYMPYAPGDLTYSIMVEMKRKFKSLTAVAEVGKVAHSINSHEQRKIAEIGELVVPVGTLASYGSTKEQFFNNKADFDHVSIFGSKGIAKTTLMQAPTVILQDGDEIDSIIHRLFGDYHHKKNISINMEGEHMREGARAAGLDVFEVDYLSDHAFSTRILKLFTAFGREALFDQITKTLDRRGVFGVHAATAAVLLALAEKVKMNE